VIEIATRIPDSVQRHIAGANIEPVTIGMSGNQIFRITRHNGSVSYLKIAPRPNEPEFHAEQLRLQWLHGRLPVPTVEAYTSDDTHTYLLLTAIPGVMSCDPRFAHDMPALVQSLAEGMRMIHAVTVADCPFDQSAATQLTRAKARAQAGLVDESDFDQRFQGKTSADVVNFLTAHFPATEDLVFTHGDFCLPNILLDPATSNITGFIDLSRAGIADRYQDIALATRSLAHNVGPGHHKALWDAYGLDKPDHDKLSFYLALDEFF
jgi:aminoglycoside phosphotransferase